MEVHDPGRGLIPSRTDRIEAAPASPGRLLHVYPPLMDTLAFSPRGPVVSIP